MAMSGHLHPGTRPARTQGWRLLHLGLGAWFLLPLVPLLLWAVADRWSFPASLPQDYGLSGWRGALDQDAARAFGRSLLLGLSVAALATPAGALAARGLALGRVPLPGLVGAVLLAPVAFPAFAVALGLDVLLIRVGLPNLVGVVLLLTVAAIPYTTYAMRVAFGAYDLAYEDEARTLGATRAQVLLRVQLPMLAPALSGAAFLAFLVAWSDYVVTVLIGGGQVVTLPLVVASAASAIGNEAVVASTSLAAIVPPLVLLVLVRLLGRRRPTGPAR